MNATPIHPRSSASILPVTLAVISLRCIDWRAGSAPAAAVVMRLHRVCSVTAAAAPVRWAYARLQWAPCCLQSCAAAPTTCAEEATKLQAALLPCEAAVDALARWASHCCAAAWALAAAAAAADRTALAASQAAAWMCGQAAAAFWWAMQWALAAAFATGGAQGMAEQAVMA